MATPQQLFISFPPEIYKKNKSSMLLSQADLLQSLRHLQNLKVLFIQKSDLIKQFHKNLSSILLQIRYLQDKIPTPKIPRTLQKHEATKQESKARPKGTFSRREGIEEELKMIQAKLEQLNS